MQNSLNNEKDFTKKGGVETPSRWGQKEEKEKKKDDRRETGRDWEERRAERNWGKKIRPGEEKKEEIQKKLSDEKWSQNSPVTEMLPKLSPTHSTFVVEETSKGGFAHR